MLSMYRENNMNRKFNHDERGAISFYQQHSHAFSFSSVKVVNNVPKIVHTIYELPRVVPELQNKLSYFNEITPREGNLDQSFNKCTLPGFDSFRRMGRSNIQQDSPQSDSSLSDSLQSIHQAICLTSNQPNSCEYSTVGSSSNLDSFDQSVFTNQASSLSTSESQNYEFQIADESEPESFPFATPTTNLIAQSPTFPQSSSNLHDRGANAVENVPSMTIQAESSVSQIISQFLFCNGSYDKEKLKSLVYDFHNEVHIEYFGRPMSPLFNGDEEPTKIVDEDPMMNLDIIT